MVFNCGYFDRPTLKITGPGHPAPVHRLVGCLYDQWLDILQLDVIKEESNGVSSSE